MATQAQVSAAEHIAAGLPPARRECPAEDASGRGARSGLRRAARPAGLSLGGSDHRISDPVWELGLKSSSSQFHKGAESTGATKQPALLVNPKV